MSDTTEPAPLTERESATLADLAALPMPTLERALERLRWLEAQNAALKAHDPLAEMWRELAEYQPMADRDGHGDTWRAMCSEKTHAAALAASRVATWVPTRAAGYPTRAAGYAAWAESSAAHHAHSAIAEIRRAKEGQR